MAGHALHITPHFAIGSMISIVLAFLFILCVLIGLLVPIRSAHGAVFAGDVAALSSIAFDMMVSIVAGWTAPMAAVVLYGRLVRR